eukprot:CAMPEP_0184353984 /NCGR_PEP_ID=MMETSP1089-20130417/84325_1 /TAXON_ID=38269 ORGANISM="Gloeochaete wittrockiana, Strain SAG46.84" /NCGR_SAMPLE_ID=MMETSP1089 /ASSEMBLY_ACC=CAM_ASM_000445 /LENGTH=73 /DNA_ID=CAMNT_0026689743 /DNA_START=24 /DNA_END=242 /DNA_ORIENTATION=+
MVSLGTGSRDAMGVTSYTTRLMDESSKIGTTSAPESRVMSYSELRREKRLSATLRVPFDILYTFCVSKMSKNF